LIIFFYQEDAMKQNISPINDGEKTLIEKIRALSPEKVTEVVDFVDFLSHRDSDRRLVQAANQLGEPAFKKVWDNPEDEVYDNL
jgi:hypothetical protein